jgi:hypothetical protein
MSNVMDWVRNCEYSHPLCARNPNSFAPSRLIDVRQGKVVEITDPNVQWVCLSHCWGGKRPQCLTTKASYETNLTRIPWESIPRTFQDAIVFTQKLGQTYIWIDSFCIIQDDIEDWRQQSSRMADIYEGAYLTLAATAATNCEAGLFNDASRVEPTHAHEIRGNPPSTIFLRKQIPHFFVTPEAAVIEQSFPLLSRAWVYQERLLSRRILHFTGSELQWECQQIVDCQCGSAVRSTYDIAPKIDHAIRISNPHTEEDSLQPNLFERWCRVVDEYSSLRLTKSKDKLPALSGLARQFSRALENSNAPLKNNINYVAGLWHSPTKGYVDGPLLLQNLLWAKASAVDLSKRPKDWRAPTWSWACVDGRVTYPWRSAVANYPSGSITFLRVQEATTIPTDSVDPTGELLSARLTVQGPLQNALLYYSTTFANNSLSPVYTLHVEDGQQVEKFIPDYAMHLPDENHGVFDQTNIRKGAHVRCLRVCHVGTEAKVLSLVLRECVSDGRQCWRRIGIAESWGTRELAESYSEPEGWPRWQGQVEVVTIV